MAIPSGYSLLGRIGYNDRGVYTESSDYVRGDVVYHEGSSYVALTTVTGVTPADDNTNWKYLARGFGATELSEIDATDTSGFAGDAGKKVKGQTLIDKIAEYVMSKVVATDSFQTYLQKFLVDNCVTERSDLSLSAAQGKVLQDQLATLNSNLKTPVIGNPTFDSSYFTNKGTQIKKIGTTVTVKIVGTIKFDAMTSFATNKIMDIPEGFRPIWSIGEYHILGKNVTDLIMIESTSIGINKQFSSGNQNVEFSIIYLTSE